MEHGLDLFSLSQFLVSRFLVPSLQTGNVIFEVSRSQSPDWECYLSRSQSPDWECYLRGCLKSGIP